MPVFIDDIAHEDAARRIDFLSDLLSCGETVHFWVYSSYSRLIRTNCPQLVLATVFEHSGCLSYMDKHFKSSSSPIILSSHLGLMWAAARSKAMTIEKESTNYIVIGPVLSAMLDSDSIKNAAHDLNIDLTWRKGFIDMIKSIPVVSPPLFFQYALMLHYCATGEKIARSSLSFQEGEGVKASETSRAASIASNSDRRQIYLGEQAILDNVRKGNIDYAADLERAHQVSNGIRITTNDPLLQAIVSTSSFASLCTRAAIEGGLSPEIAYNVGDSYIQSMLNCKTITELRGINHAMYEDFINRVHNHNSSNSYSKQIQSLMEYVSLHLTEDLETESLASRFGYTTYYLSRKFKEETGKTLNSYIKSLRLEKAKTLLVTTDMNIASIADKLRFCSSSYFSKQFQQETGMLPQQYRNENQKI